MTVIYLGLACLEATRLLLMEARPVPDSGFFEWEIQVDETRAARPFRWTGSSATLHRSAEGPVLVVPFYMSRPDIDSTNVSVQLLADDQLLDTVSLRGNGWRSSAYFVTPLISSAQRSGYRESSRRAPSGTRPSWSSSALEWLHQWRELVHWAPREAAPLELRIEVTPTFVPASLIDSPDRRTLGVGVGAMTWSHDVPETGIGFHDPETAVDGTHFRWTSRLWASQPVRVRGRIAIIKLRADHPDIEPAPVAVRVYWDEHLLETVTLTDRQWYATEIDIGAPNGSDGIMSFRVDRTWSPASGGSPDERELGVAVSDVAWR